MGHKNRMYNCRCINKLEEIRTECIIVNVYKQVGGEQNASKQVTDWKTGKECHQASSKHKENALNKPEKGRKCI